MRAAPLATAKSPATVAWLSVMDGALAPTAMAITAAMLFITVFGKIIGESPDGPRRRKPLKNSAPDRKSPYSLPTASPNRGPPSNPASLAAKRQAASAMRQMRDSRRTSATSKSAMSSASSTSAASPLCLSTGKVFRAAMASGGRASAAAMADDPPCPAALTEPMPVIATRRDMVIARRRGSRSDRRSRRSWTGRF